MRSKRERLARQARRDAALRRSEIADAPTAPRAAPAGPMSAPVKVMDPETRALIDAAIEKRNESRC